MAGLPVLLFLIFAMRFYHTSCSLKWLSSPHNYRICLFMIKWQITNWKHLFSNFLWIHIYVLSLWPWHETYCTTSGSHIYENISCCVPQKMFLGQIHICLSKCTVQHLSVKIGYVCFWTKIVLAFQLKRSKTS